MKKHRSLALAIVLPTFLAIVLGEALIYLGAYFSLRDSDYRSATTNDEIDLAFVANDYSENGYTLLGYALVPIIKAYEENKPEKAYPQGSEEELAYRTTLERAAANQLYNAAESRLERFVTTFVGLFYEDTEKNRMVLVCTSDHSSTEVEDKMETVSIHLGSFFTKRDYFVESGFYGKTINDPVVGDLFVSGLYVAEVSHPTIEDDGGPYRIWIIRETLEKDIYANIPNFSRSFAIIAAAVGVSLVAVLFVLLFFVVIRPTRRLSEMGNEFSKGLLEGEQKHVFVESKGRHQNEISDLNDALYTAQEAISDYSAKLRDSAAKEERINADLALAERIQSNMVPHKPLMGKGFLVRGFMKPAKEVGGDLYNYFKVDDDHIAFFIGDVSGKGVPAALFMAKANTVLRLAAMDFDFDRANRELCEGNAENLFVTAFMGLLEISTGKLRYVNAGHEPVFIYRSGKYEALEEEANFMLGYIPDLDYVVQETTLMPGNRLFLYTDGISEAMNVKGELFGKERILEALNSTMGMPSSSMFPLVRGAVEKFVGEAEQSDDACVLSLDYGEEATFIFEENATGLVGVADFIDEFLHDANPEVRSIIQVVADEMCSNVIYYSKSQKPVHFSLRKDDKTIEGFIVDEGVAFNPLEREPKVNEDKPGGLGIIMTKSLVDEIDYARVEGRNILRFRKKIA